MSATLSRSGDAAVGGEADEVSGTATAAATASARREEVRRRFIGAPDRRAALLGRVGWPERRPGTGRDGRASVSARVGRTNRSIERERWGHGPIPRTNRSIERERHGDHAPMGASGRIRTCGTWYRKPVLYPLSYGGNRPLQGRARPYRLISG